MSWWFFLILVSVVAIDIAFVYGADRRRTASNMLETEARALRELTARHAEWDRLALGAIDGQQGESVLADDHGYDADTAFHDAWVAPAQETIDRIDRELGIIPDILEAEPEVKGSRTWTQVAGDSYEVRSWDGTVRREIRA